MRGYIFAGALLLVGLWATDVAAQNSTVEMLTDVPSQCSKVQSFSAGGRRLQESENHTIYLSSETVHWGYYYSALEPAAVLQSGETITVETATHHAGDDYNKMIKGDPGMEDIYEWSQKQINVPLRGRTGHGDGVHLLTGPIYVCGAEPGDVLQVDILDIVPRINPASGKTYGSNAAASWGYQYKAGFLDGIKREVITIYEILRDSANNLLWAVPDYQFTYNAPQKGYVGPVTTCTETYGLVPETANGIHYEWNDTSRLYRYNTPVPCENGTQTWTSYLYPGVITPHPTGTEDYDIRGKFKVPINFHIGNMGVASYYSQLVDSVPPAIHGGNIDDRRIGKGATMYYPVQVNGALLSLGDCHTAMGDSELDGTGIETSVTPTLRVTLHKKNALPLKVSKLHYPLLENDNEFAVHGFNYMVRSSCQLPEGPAQPFQGHLQDQQSDQRLHQHIQQHQGLHHDRLQHDGGPGHYRHHRRHRLLSQPGREWSVGHARHCPQVDVQHERHLTIHAQGHGRHQQACECHAPHQPVRGTLLEGLALGSHSRGKFDKEDVHRA